MAIYAIQRSLTTELDTISDDSCDDELRIQNASCISDDDSEDSTRAGTTQMSRDIRILTGFWLLGMSNNFGYSVMLAAAYDILESPGSSSNDSCGSNHTVNSTHHLICNQAGTGVVLLADILPTVFIKITAPFFMSRISYNVRVTACLLAATASYVLVAIGGNTTKWLSIFGVAMASVNSGLGEIVFLSFTSYFSKATIAAWSSGTGAAGVLASVTYSGLRQIHVSPRNSLLIMLVIPFIQTISYFFILVKPRVVSGWYLWSKPKSEEYRPLISSTSVSEFSNEDETPDAVVTSADQLGFIAKIKLIKPLLKYMLPLMLVYFAEYFINQALVELAYFPASCGFLSIQDQYRWFQTIYQIGVFISRSSVSCFKLKLLWILPILQCVNVGTVLCQVLYHYFPESNGLWIMFAIILWEGLLGGSGYVNTFYRISQEVPPEHKEFSLGVASLADTSGIVVSAFVSIVVHNQICARNITWQ